MRQNSATDSSFSKAPQPGPEALAHSRELEAHIARQIEDSGGRISFARFMDLALYAPGLGYYSAGSRKLGEAGDFVTAPEISPLFGRCLATQVQQVLQQLGGGAVLELGAGSGALAADILQQLEKLGQLPQRYLILEVSADLRQRQQQTLARRLPHLLDRLEWLDCLPEGLGGVVLANEVMDALPVERFRVQGAGIVQLGVAHGAAGFSTVDLPCDPALEARWEELRRELPGPLAQGYRSEICMGLRPWVGALAGALRRGALLLVDYGLPRAQYYHPERGDGTLICHYRHRAHADPFQWVGLQDITAWVDFTTVAESAVDCGLELMGFTPQAQFLLGAGLEGLLAEATAGDTRTRLQAAAEAKKLTLPGEMGERFKVMGLSRGLQAPLSGFGLKDLSPSL